MEKNREFKNKSTSICIILDKYIKAGDISFSIYGVRTIIHIYTHKKVDIYFILDEKLSNNWP